MIIDLHAHTQYSDGQYSVSQLIQLAIMQNISYLAIVDHDDMRSYSEQSQNSQINIVHGIEFSTVANCNNQQYHLIVLINKNNETGLKRLETLINTHYSLVFAQICQNSTLTHCSQPFTTSLLFTIVNNSNTTSSPCSNFYTCLKQNFNIKMPLLFQVTEEIIKTAAESNFYTILPHPFREMKSNSTFSQCLREFSNLGLNALEIEHFSNSAAQKRVIYKMSRQLNLTLSIGSDFHSQGRKVRTGVDLGYWQGNQRINEILRCKVVFEVFGEYNCFIQRFGGVVIVVFLMGLIMVLK